VLSAGIFLFGFYFCWCHCHGVWFVWRAVLPLEAAAYLQQRHWHVALEPYAHRDSVLHPGCVQAKLWTVNVEQISPVTREGMAQRCMSSVMLLRNHLITSHRLGFYLRIYPCEPVLFHFADGLGGCCILVWGGGWVACDFGLYGVDSCAGHTECPKLRYRHMYWWHTHVLNLNSAELSCHGRGFSQCYSSV